MATRKTNKRLAEVVETLKLNPEQAAEVERVLDVVAARVKSDLRHVVARLADKPLSELFGAAEFELRDAVHRVGAAALETVLDERKKGGASGRRPSVRSAARTRSSRAT